MYKEALDAMEEVNIFKVSPGGLYYARIYDHKSNSHWNSMLYSGCYLGAMLSMGASAMEHALALNNMIGKKNKVIEQNRIARHWHLAEQITRTCQLASERTKTGLGPDRFYYNETQDGVTDQLHKDYYLSAEFAESNFILWRLTNKPKYRDNAWEMALAIDRHCRVDGGGYAAIWDVNKLSTTNKRDYQPAIFLSATLKYLYLTFTDDSVLSLDQWVFNSCGHPLPICGKHGSVSS